MEYDMQFSQIDYTVSDAIATITLQRPDRLNAYTHTMARELSAACDLVENDDDVRVVVVTGSGRAFCAGADLEPEDDKFTKERRPDEYFSDGSPRDPGGQASLKFAALRKPVIAAINGPAVGIGATLTVPFDIRIAAESARFGFVFTRRCLVPEAGSTFFLPRVVGMSRAMEWVATGRLFDAAEALSSGLVTRVCPDSDLMDTVYALAADIRDNVAPVAFAAAKQMMWGMWGADGPWAAHRMESQVLEEVIRSADFAEGVGAFLERRKPSFTMSPNKDLPAVIPSWPQVD
ncbi:enoyl-CoA hydratase-related protein [Nocardia sp. NPDC055029]